MPTIAVQKIDKSFGTMRAVDDVSFSVEPGEIFGLLGPNGAGKTTTIRIILDIFKPDRGSVSILGGPMSEEKKNRIGYLPEERGLYQDVQLERALVYLATLKGLSAPEAKRRVNAYLERFELAEHRRKKVKELSKGMQQKAQLVVTLVHEPELVIIDEPFSALDPVNTQMVKDILREQRRQGVTIVMCTHQMHQVEELCDRIVLINHGKVMLYGQLDDVRRTFAGQEVVVRALRPLPAVIEGVETIETSNSNVHLHLKADVSPQQVLRALVDQDIPLEQFEIAIPTLDEIFIQVVRGEGIPA
ncbi:MAG: ATP-binding cassette domain-containing protein [Chloroflexi bacterium]|nr:ATP-binding cassette domain-containing protein [Anaerolineaceae bacterium]NMB89136.1 ATP-binding cassette domain-containing protein [Chloroflexota bacterium]